MRISIDTETTGVDLHHGAAPYFVTICDQDQSITYYEWDVDPLTRMPWVPRQDIAEIQDKLDSAEEIVLQNAKFDVQALTPFLIPGWEWPWEKTWDNLLASHLVASNQPKDLTTLALIHLGVNVKPLDDALARAVKAALSLVSSSHPDWRRAKKGLPEMPSAKEKVWKFDGWVPRALAFAEGYDKGHEWYTVLADYANSDSSVTLPIHDQLVEEIKRRNLWDIYLERRKLVRIPYIMERHGVTVNGERLDELHEEYVAESKRAETICSNIARAYDYEIDLPKSGNNKSLSTFIFDVMKLEPFKKSKKTGAPSIDKSTLEHYEASLPERSRPGVFVRTLKGKRKRDTAISYLESYKRFWLPWATDEIKLSKAEREAWHILHPSLNSTGTDTLRWSSSNPNEQNISKQEGFNLRYCFGPAPGREWWSLDAKNIELRLPAYEAKETEMIALFERPDDAPYYGSYHMLVFDTLHPDKFAKHGKACKDVYESTWYQWTKNGNFAVQYGAMEASGTADRAYHIEGAQRRIQGRFNKIADLNKYWIQFANDHGYVETMPDNEVDPVRGYPLLCTRSKWGQILPTVPLNYHIQGTAMWWMMLAMIGCQEYLDEVNRKSSGDYKMIMQVHDELVFDFPAGTGVEPWKTNLPKVKQIQRIMEAGGDRLGLPTPVSRKYHATTWSEGISA